MSSSGKVGGRASAKFIIVADYRKKVQCFGYRMDQGVPIEIVPNAYAKVTLDLKKLGAKRIDLRQGGKAKAGPVITDNNNFLIDADFGAIADPKTLHTQIKALCGVVDSGLFTNLANKAYFGEQNGDISVWLV